jgi:hypothetical protein
MKTLIILSSVLFLSGCAGCKSHCILGFGPGNPTFDSIGHMKNTDDPCQYIGKPPGYQLASFCFANAGRKVYHVRDVNGKILYKVTQ